MASESQLPYRQVNICASLEMTTKWIPACKPPILPSLTTIYNLFMQNEPNLVRRRRIANSLLTKDYEEKCGKDLWKNEPNSKPNKPNFKSVEFTVRAIGLKEMWRLKWHRVFDIHAESPVWPAWMSNFRDY